MKKLRTHYDNLKISRKANAAEIRKAYRRLASIHHPDKNANSPASVKAMQCINKAYEVLSDPVARANHDAWIEASEYSAPAVTRHAPPSAGSNNTGSHFSGSEPRHLFDPREFPPPNWDSSHYVEFYNYTLGMRRLLDDDEVGLTRLSTLYKAFLFDKKLGNLKHSTKSEAKEAIKRANDPRPGLFTRLGRKLGRFGSLDAHTRQAILIGAVLILSAAWTAFS